MSYRLADGSMSTDYKIGDKFYIIEGADEGRLATLLEDDGSEMPWFDKGIDDRNCELWAWLKPCNEENNADIIDLIRETIKQLKATIKELEQ
jgi:hypothetical protein